jgi:hypothetical protein
MKTFLEFLEERNLTPAGRVKKVIAIRKHRYKLKQRANIARRIGSSTRRLDRRTKMAAIRDIYRNIVKRKGGKLSSTQKAAAERTLYKRGTTHVPSAMLKRRPKLRIADTQRKKS